MTTCTSNTECAKGMRCSKTVCKCKQSMWTWILLGIVLLFVCMGVFVVVRHLLKTQAHCFFGEIDEKGRDMTIPCQFWEAVEHYRQRVEVPHDRTG